MKDLKSKIISSLEKDMKVRLEIKPQDSLPVYISKTIEKKAKEVEDSIMNTYIQKQAISIGKAQLREKDIKGVIDTRLTGALTGMQIISESSEIDKILKENATMLFKKKKALTDAGFTEDEAFRLILAEVSARKSK